MPTKGNQDPYEAIINNLQDISKNYNELNAFDKEECLKQMTNEIRKINIFPIRYFSEDSIGEEIRAVINKNNVSFIDDKLFTQSREGLLLLDFLFPNIHLAHTCNVKTNAYERFYNDETLKYILDKYLSQNKKIGNLRTVYLPMTRWYFDSPINFTPIRAKAIYEKFVPKGGIIYDYSCGFGGRMLGALGSKNNYIYIGTDPNKNTYFNLLKLGKYIEKETKRNHSYKIFNLESERFELKKDSVDFAFSCPPFFNKEFYSDEETQSIINYPKYNDWLENYVRPTIKNCYQALKSNGVFGFDILNYSYGGKMITLVEDWSRIAQEEGFYFKQKFSIASRFRKNNKENTEFIYMFTKDENLELPNYTDDIVKENTIDQKNKLERAKIRKKIINLAEYDIFGELINVYSKDDDIYNQIYLLNCKTKIIPYNNKYYYIYRGDDIIKQQIKVKSPLAFFNNIYFYSYSEMARYFGISRQSIQQKRQKGKTQVRGNEIEWYDNY